MGAPTALRVPDQKSCDTKEHQGRAQALERQRNDPGSDDPQAEADHERAPTWDADSLVSSLDTAVGCQVRHAVR
jgi:hypothetical protein